MRFSPRGGILSVLALTGLFPFASGCSFDISRERTNAPLNQRAYRRLEVDKTTLGEALDALGAPHKLEYKAGREEDYLWYLHRDSSRFGVRIESPVAFFGYRHTFVEVDVDAEDTSSMGLVFDREGILRLKNLRLAPAYAGSDDGQEQSPQPWAIYLLPRYGWSPLSYGDAGEKNFRDLYDQGQLVGGDIGIMPAPYFMLLAGGNFQRYDGDSFRSGGRTISVEDLRLYQAEIGGRFQVPPRFFARLGDANKLKELFYSEDTRLHQGVFITFQWTFGVTFNEDVGADIDGVPSGTYFDKSIGLSSTIGIGGEYRWQRLGVHAGLEYQIIDGFKGGNAPIDTGAGDFHSVLITAGMSLTF